MERKFIRINEHFIRFDRIASIEIERLYQTDSCIDVKIRYIDGCQTLSFFINSDKWMPEQECKEYFEPRIKKLIEFVEKAIAGTLTEFEIEI
jgi:hypothetical protein